MTPSPKIWVVALVFAMVSRATGESIERMNQPLELVWSVTGENLESRQQVHFGFSPGYGLTDIDFHRITASEWPAMKSPTADAVAILQVVAGTPISQVEEVVRQIAERGGYKTVVVTVGQ